MEVVETKEHPSYRKIRFEDAKLGTVYKDERGWFRWKEPDGRPGSYWFAGSTGNGGEVEIRVYESYDWPTCPMMEWGSSVTVFPGSGKFQMGEDNGAEEWKKRSFVDLEIGKAYVDRYGTLYWKEVVKNFSQVYEMVTYLTLTSKVPVIKMIGEDSADTLEPWEISELREWHGQITLEF
jgi:hypothetical protein